MKESFAVDVNATKETWNQPVHGYKFSMQEVHPPKHAYKAFKVTALLTYIEDDGGKETEEERQETLKLFSWWPTLGTSRHLTATMKLEYILEVDRNDRIIGGEWLGKSKTNHPDLFWKPTKKVNFTEEFELLKTLYRPSRPAKTSKQNQDH
jgi:hypothetical protein